MLSVAAIDDARKAGWTTHYSFPPQANATNKLQPQALKTVTNVATSRGTPGQRSKKEEITNLKQERQSTVTATTSGAGKSEEPKPMGKGKEKGKGKRDCVNRVGQKASNDAWNTDHLDAELIGVLQPFTCLGPCAGCDPPRKYETATGLAKNAKDCLLLCRMLPECRAFGLRHMPTGKLYCDFFNTNREDVIFKNVCTHKRCEKNKHCKEFKTRTPLLSPPEAWRTKIFKLKADRAEPYAWLATRPTGPSLWLSQTSGFVKVSQYASQSSASGTDTPEALCFPIVPYQDPATGDPKFNTCDRCTAELDFGKIDKFGCARCPAGTQPDGLHEVSKSGTVECKAPPTASVTIKCTPEYSSQMRNLVEAAAIDQNGKSPLPGGAAPWPSVLCAAGLLPSQCSNSGVVKTTTKAGWPGHRVMHVTIGCKFWKIVSCVSVWSTQAGRYGTKCANSKKTSFAYLDTCSGVRGHLFNYKDSSTHGESTCPGGIRDERRGYGEFWGHDKGNQEKIKAAIHTVGPTVFLTMEEIGNAVKKIAAENQHACLDVRKVCFRNDAGPCCQVGDALRSIYPNQDMSLEGICANAAKNT